MERLTVEIENEIFYIDNRLDDYLAVDEMSVLDILSALRKLKTYEDAEEQGLLLRLPCKVGSTVYSIVKDGLQIFELKFTLDFYVRRKSDFGKTVFFTREAAEKALETMKRGGGKSED